MYVYFERWDWRRSVNMDWAEADQLGEVGMSCPDVGGGRVRRRRRRAERITDKDNWRGMVMVGVLCDGLDLSDPSLDAKELGPRRMLN
mmetsp:Transcript_4903/g.10287  ORF Transcript_4903/g.10287 Transcript_4903/m.10287 type:complete len:88 (-) Transcript_4903:158-421(-)